MGDLFNSTTFAPNALDVIFVNAEQRLVAVFAGVSLALVLGFLICLRVVDWLMTRFRWRWKSNPVSADRRQALAVLYNSSQIAFYVVRLIFPRSASICIPDTFLYHFMVTG